MLPFTAAPIADVVVVATVRVVTVNVPLVAPAAIVVVAGTVAADVLPDERLTVRPPEGAAELIVIVPVEGRLPKTVVGFNVRFVIVGPFTVRVAVPLDEFEVAVRVAVRFAATATVVAVKVPVVAPVAIVIVPGTVTEVLLDVRTTEYPAGAALLMVTVPVEVPAVPGPPTTVVGLRTTDEIVGARTVRGVETVVVPLVAEMFAVALAAIWEVVTVKVPDEAPVAIVTEPGTCAAALLEAKVKVIAAGADPDNVTVAVVDPPPRTLEEARVTPVGIGALMVRSTGPSFTPNALAEMCEMKLLETG